MSATRRGLRLLVAALSVLTTAGASGLAQAQDAALPIASDLRAVALDRFEPTAPSNLFSSVESPGPDRSARLSAGLLLTYADAPLVVRAPREGRTEVVSAQWVGHVQFGLHLLESLSLDLDVPSTWAARGQFADLDQRELPAPPSQSLHDVRVGSRLSILGQADLVPSVGVSLRVWLPTGDDTGYTGAGRTRYALHGLVGADYAKWSYRIAVGRRQRGARSELRLLAGDAALGLAVGFHLAPGLLVGPELDLARVTSPRPAVVGAATNAELIATVAYCWGPWTLRAGAGPGIGAAPGTPRFRLLAALGFALQPARGEASRSVASEERWSTGPEVTQSAAGAVPATTEELSRSKRGTTGSAPQVCAAVAECPTSVSARTDTDGDGFRDAFDDCPSVTGEETREGRVGCPRDGDDDGVADPEDACPRDPGSAADTVTLNGCPRQVMVRGDQLELTREVVFSSGSDRIDPESLPLLATLAAILGAHPELTRVGVDGHTDNVGSERDNLVLSQRRALAVMRWLVAAGVDERRLEARGLGPRQPKTSNETEQGRLANRRVEFLVIRRDPAGSSSWQDGATDD